MNKKEKMVLAAIRVLYEFSDEHIKDWEREIKENEGYLKANLKINLYAIRKQTKLLRDKYTGITVTETYGDKLLSEIRDIHRINKKQNKKVVLKKNQRYTPSSTFISFFYVIGNILDTIKKHYQLTVERMGIDTEFDKIIDNYNKYGKFFEEEIVIMEG